MPIFGNNATPVFGPAGPHCQLDGRRARFTGSVFNSSTAVLGAPLGASAASVRLVEKGSRYGYIARVGFLPEGGDLDRGLGNQPGAVGVRSTGHLAVGGKAEGRDLAQWHSAGARLRLDWDGRSLLRVSLNGQTLCERRDPALAACRFAVGGGRGVTFELELLDQMSEAEAKAKAEAVAKAKVEAEVKAKAEAEADPCSRLVLQLSRCMPPVESAAAVPWDEEQPYFDFLPRAEVLQCASTALPSMQRLRAAGKLRRKTVDLAAAYRGEGFVKRVLFVSHRWETPGAPDSTGAQLQAIQAHLDAHPGLDFVWFDYSCMPQKESATVDGRSARERREFQLMLLSIADLYLTSKVLILLDNTYMTRFWTLMESWCAMMTVTPRGVRAARDTEVRYSITCLHQADPKYSLPMLVEKLSTKTPREVAEMLASPDVQVTNQKDKEALLPAVRETDEHVRRVLLSA